MTDALSPEAWATGVLLVLPELYRFSYSKSKLISELEMLADSAVRSALEITGHSFGQPPMHGSTGSGHDERRQAIDNQRPDQISEDTVPDADGTTNQDASSEATSEVSFKESVKRDLYTQLADDFESRFSEVVDLIKEDPSVELSWDSEAMIDHTNKILGKSVTVQIKVHLKAGTREIMTLSAEAVHDMWEDDAPVEIDDSGDPEARSS